MEESEVYEYNCYLDDAMGIDTSEKMKYHICRDCIIFKKCCFKDKVNGECYKDPDASSRNLYKDLAVIYNCKVKDMNLDFGIKKGVNPYNEPCLYLDKSIFGRGIKSEYISSDYIGPSRKKAKTKKWKIKEDEIGQTLRTCRTIGGHIFWPGFVIEKKTKTINVEKGGNSDRIDYTLAELKNFLDRKESKFEFSKSLFEAFGRYEEFFNLFGERGNPKTFKNFVDFFFLNGFVNDEYEVYDLTTDNELINKDIFFTEDSYKKFSKRCGQIILGRTSKIVEFAKENNLVIEDTKRGYMITK